MKLGLYSLPRNCRVGPNPRLNRTRSSRLSLLARAVSVAALETFGGALRGSSTAGFRVRTVEPRCRFYWQSGGL